MKTLKCALRIKIFWIWSTGDTRGNRAKEGVRVDLMSVIVAWGVVATTAGAVAAILTYLAHRRR